MKLIVGLGNPGQAYATTRHNIGFMVAKAVAEANSIVLKKDNLAAALTGKGKIGEEAAAVALPLTFMNISGLAVRELLKKYAIDSPDLLVVCDDLDLDFGVMRLRQCGSSGGHKGLASIIDAAGTQDFSRLRVGIGRPPERVEASDYVLTSFTRSQAAELVSIIEAARDCCQGWAIDGIEKTMNTFNKRSRSNE